jgi:hypothetical protein
MLQSHISGFQDEITDHHSKLKAHHVRREDEYLLLVSSKHQQTTLGIMNGFGCGCCIAVLGKIGW